MNDTSLRRSAISTVLVMGCTLISRILGFVRTAAIGAIFGAGGSADVINLVFNIPNNLRKLLAEGALSTAFIPELSRQINDGTDRKNARHLASTILGLQIVVIVPILLITTLFPGLVVNVFENFADPEKRELSAVMLKWMMPYLLLISVSAVQMAVQNTHDRFFIPAITPPVFSICVIACLLVGQRSWGEMALAYGVLIGGLMQILVQYSSYRGLGYSLSPMFDFNNPAFKRVIKTWAPMLLTSSLFAVNNQIAMFLASLLRDKSASTLSYAIVFYQLPFGIFSASITTVLYPRMSRQAVGGDREGLLMSLGLGYRNLMALLVPSAMVMMVLGKPIIAIAFQRGAFTLTDTILTAEVLLAYSIGMPFVGLFNITQRAFYAMGQVRKPFLCSLAMVSLDILLSLIFVFQLDGGSASLALANSMAFAFGAALQYGMIKKNAGFSITRKTLLSIGKTLLGSGAGLLVMLLALSRIGSEWWMAGSSWTSLVLLGAICLISAAVILLLYVWMRVEVVSILLKTPPKKPLSS